MAAQPYLLARAQHLIITICDNRGRALVKNCHWDESGIPSQGQSPSKLKQRAGRPCWLGEWGVLHTALSSETGRTAMISDEQGPSTGVWHLRTLALKCLQILLARWHALLLYADRPKFHVPSSLSPLPPCFLLVTKGFAETNVIWNKWSAQICVCVCVWLVLCFMCERADWTTNSFLY